MINIVSTLSSFLQVTRISIKSCIGSKLGKIGPGSVELAALECLEKFLRTSYGLNVVNTLVRPFFEWIFIILAGNKDSQKNLNEFEFLSDSIADCWVGCSCVSQNQWLMMWALLAPSFMIESSSFQQETRTAI